MNHKITAILAFGLLVAGAQAENQESVAVSTAQFRVVNAKTDVLGRHNPNSKGTPTAFVDNIQKKKVLAKVDPLFDNEIPIQTRSGAYINDRSNNYGREYQLYIGNGTASSSNRKSAAEYTYAVNSIETNDQARIAYANSRIQKTYSNLTDDHFDVSFFKSNCYGKSNCVIDGINHTNIKQFFARSNLTAAGLNQNISGSGIGIYFIENVLPIPSVVQKMANGRSVSSFYEKKGNCPLPGRDYPARTVGEAFHGTSVLKVLHYAAPKAMIYGYNFNCTSLVTHEVAAPANPYQENIHIGTHSYGRPNYYTLSSDIHTFGAFYDFEAASIDNYVYNTRVVEFASAGNSGEENNHQLSSIARGVNVIAVGAVNETDKYENKSSWKNPLFQVTNFDYDKPEIANYTNVLFNTDDSLLVSQKKTQEELEREIKQNKIITKPKKGKAPIFEATSASTPYTAAMVADLMSYAPFYQWHPEVVKPLLLTTSIKEITGALDHDSDNHNKKIGKGIPEFLAMKQGNRSRYWNGNNDDFYKTNCLTFYEYNIKKGKRYRIAISWLSDGNFVLNKGDLPQRNTLYVYQGSKSYASGYSHNSFQMVDFVAESDDPLKILIRRTANRGGRVLMGYNLHESDY